MSIVGPAVRWPEFPVMAVEPRPAVAELVEQVLDRAAPALAARLAQHREELDRIGRRTVEDEAHALFDLALSIELGDGAAGVVEPAVTTDPAAGPESVAIEDDVLLRKQLIRVVH